MELWIVEQFVRGVFDVREWDWEKGKLCFEFQGVFDSEEKAIAACRNEYYYIYPAILNDNSLPHESVPMKGGYYPLAKDKQKGPEPL